jgi:hypothetical protein
MLAATTASFLWVTRDLRKFRHASLVWGGLLAAAKLGLKSIIC